MGPVNDSDLGITRLLCFQFRRNSTTHSIEAHSHVFAHICVDLDVDLQQKYVIITGEMIQ